MTRAIFANRSSGFTLIEILFSIGILSLGMLGIGSLLPVAGVLQKETIDQITTRQIVKAAQAVIDASSINTSMLDAIAILPTRMVNSDKRFDPNIILYSSPDGSSRTMRLRTRDDAKLIVPITAIDPTDAVLSAKQLTYSLSIYDRTYPASSPIEKRKYIWEPVFIQDRQTLEWSWSLFIMKFDGNLDLPPHVLYTQFTASRLLEFRNRKIMMRDTAEAVLIDNDFALDSENAKRFILHGATGNEYNTLLITSMGSL